MYKKEVNKKIPRDKSQHEWPGNSNTLPNMQKSLNHKMV